MICRLHNQNISYFIINPDIKQASSSTFKCNQCLESDYINPNDKIISVHNANMMSDNEWEFQKERIAAYFDRVTKIHHNIVTNFNGLINNILKEIAKKMMIVKHTNFKLVEEWIKINKEQIDNYFFSGNTQTRTMLELSKIILESNDEMKAFNYYNSYIQQVKKIDQVQNLKYNKESIEFFESYIRHLQQEFIDKFDKHFVNSTANYFSQRSNLNIKQEMANISDKFVQQEANYYEHMFNTLKSMPKPTNIQPNQPSQQTSFQSSSSAIPPQPSIPQKNTLQNTIKNQQNLNQSQPESLLPTSLPHTNQTIPNQKQNFSSSNSQIEVQNSSNNKAIDNKNKKSQNIDNKNHNQKATNSNQNDKEYQLKGNKNSDNQNKKSERDQERKDIQPLQNNDSHFYNNNNTKSIQKQQETNLSKQKDKLLNKQNGQDLNIVQSQILRETDNKIISVDKNVNSSDNQNSIQNFKNNSSSSEDFSFNKKALNNENNDDNFMDSNNKSIQNSSITYHFINNNYSPFENLRLNGLIQNTSFDQNDDFFQEHELNKSYTINELSNFAEQIEKINLIQDSEPHKQVIIMEQQNPQEEPQQSLSNKIDLETLLNNVQNDLIQLSTDQNDLNKDNKPTNEDQIILENINNNIETINENMEIQEKDVQVVLSIESQSKETENNQQSNNHDSKEVQNDSDQIDIMKNVPDSQQNQVENQLQEPSKLDIQNLEQAIQNENISKEQSQDIEIVSDKQFNVVSEVSNDSKNTLEIDKENIDKNNFDNQIELETSESNTLENNQIQIDSNIEIEDEIIKLDSTEVFQVIEQPHIEKSSKNKQNKHSSENKTIEVIELDDKIIQEEQIDQQKPIKEKLDSKQKSNSQILIDYQPENKKQTESIEKEQKSSPQFNINSSNIVKRDKKITIVKLKDQSTIKQEQDKNVVQKQNEQENENSKLPQYQFKKIIINKKSQPHNIGVQHSIKKKTIKLNIVKISGNQNNNQQCAKQEPNLSLRDDEDDSLFVQENMEGFFNKKYVTK